MKDIEIERGTVTRERIGTAIEKGTAGTAGTGRRGMKQCSSYGYLLKYVL